MTSSLLGGIRTPPSPSSDDVIYEQPLTADEAVHAVCCKNKQDVDKRKVKIGGKAKAEVVNQNLQEFQIQAQQIIQHENLSEESRDLMAEALSKIKGLKVKDGKKKQKMPEVD